MFYPNALGCVINEIVEIYPQPVFGWARIRLSEPAEGQQGRTPSPDLVRFGAFSTRLGPNACWRGDNAWKGS